MALIMHSPTVPLSSPPSDSPGSPAPIWRLSKSSGLAPPQSPYPQHVDPSPTDSNGTEGTEIDEDSQDEAMEDENDDEKKQDIPGSTTASSPTNSPATLDSLARISTNLPVRQRNNSDEEPQSVIHAPSGFLGYNVTPPVGTQDHDTTVQKTERGVGSPITPDAAVGPDDKRMSVSSPLNTDVPRNNNQYQTTPQAQTRQEAEESAKSESQTSSRLEGIPESLDQNGAEEGLPEILPSSYHSSTDALQIALVESWNLCNTLANLSSSHRNRMFGSASDSAQEHVWQSCWRLCQKLYESYDSPSPDALPVLELCRNFCQALFEVRQRGESATDSILRVSFEMNNHLYNTHDRSLPEAFRERTLDFYVTMCHRMMKHPTTLAPETDTLLRACWYLAEMLFNLRQAGRMSRGLDDELLGSAMQACWELSDLFREGWSQVRPDRSTPRPSQSSFPRINNVRGSASSVHSTARPASSLSSSSYHDAPSLPPETPITIFDDTTTSSPDSLTVPNILVLGPASTTAAIGGNSLSRGGGRGGGGGGGGGGTHHDRWSSNASTLSNRSESATTSSSKRSSSTATAASNSNDNNAKEGKSSRKNTENSYLLRLQYLILKAAMNAGFPRASAQPFPSFVKSLPVDAFGPLSWQKQLLDHYRSLVDADASLRALNNLPSKRLAAREVAKAVRWLVRDEKWAWMMDLYRFVCGTGADEAVAVGGNRGGGSGAMHFQV